MTAGSPHSDTLAAALPREMVRLTALLPLYDAIPEGALAAALMRASVARAQDAIAAGDLVAMIQAYVDLKDYSA